MSASHAAIRKVTLAALRADSLGQVSAKESAQQWSNSSVGDLEALDSILDQLVVLDTRMRSALLRGPLISFETVVPETRSGPMTGFPGEEDLRDNTFITGVKGITEEAEEEEEAQAAAMPQQEPGMAEELRQFMSSPFAAITAALEVPPPQDALLASIPEAADQRGAAWGLPQHVPNQPITSDAELEALRAAIPVPILPKLARMYVSSKQAATAKGPPPPAPTADYLLRTRPAPAIAAPSYDDLCSQIRDVQRQYTCGSAPTVTRVGTVSPGRMQRMGTTLDCYISGLDGPLLEDVVMQQDLPVAIVSALHAPWCCSVKFAARVCRGTGEIRCTRMIWERWGDG